MMIHPVYVDGPLKGKDCPVDRNGPLSVGAVDPDVDVTGELQSNIVYYQIKKFGFTSGGRYVYLFIGYCGPEPNAEVLADMILNDAAKKAMVVRPPEFGTVSG